jgi:peptide chain release factor 2
LEKKTAEPDFWKDPEKAQAILKQIDSLKGLTEKYHKLSEELNEGMLLLELSSQDNDPKTLKEAEKELNQVEEKIEDFELFALMTGEDDGKNALLTIHPGAGGTESCDWAEMLLRMYLRWIERKGFKHQIIDYQAGEEAGIKNATVEVTGEYAYGFLKAESGVHRLVRISPFDANQRRHTSFASVFVCPEIEDTIVVDIKPDDLKVDTFRSSGAGGQHVNKTSSAVRITHIPTGIVVQCQSERSQFKNKDNAMKVLKSRLYQYHKQKEEEKQAQIESTKKKIEWGSQIRSYVFHPYTLVKDHRTGIETSNGQAVMDGEIDEFIQAYLRKKDK